MFNVTTEMLEILIAFKNQPGWTVFLKEFEKLRDSHAAESLHFIPDPADFNAKERENILRGITICLDVLCHAFSDPIDTLEHIKIIEKTAEITKNQNPF